MRRPHVRRERDASDERRLAASLPASGQALRAQAEPMPPAIVARLGLPPADLRHLPTVLTEVIAAADRAVTAGPGEAGQPGQPSE